MAADLRRQILLREVPNVLSESDRMYVAEHTNGFTGADLRLLLTEATLYQLDHIQSNETTIHEHETPISDNETPINSNETLNHTNETFISYETPHFSETPNNTNETHIHANETPTHTNETPTHTNETPTPSLQLYLSPSPPSA